MKYQVSKMLMSKTEIEMHEISHKSNLLFTLLILTLSIYQ